MDTFNALMDVATPRTNASIADLLARRMASARTASNANTAAFNTQVVTMAAPALLLGSACLLEVGLPSPYASHQC